VLARVAATATACSPAGTGRVVVAAALGASAANALGALLVSVTSYTLAWSVAAVALLAAALPMLIGRQLVRADRARRAAVPA
jgi:hypothetical protein